MSVHEAQRPMTGIPPTVIEVRIGFDRSGKAKAAIDSDKYRSISLPLDSPEMVSRLIGDLQEALDHLLEDA